MKQPYVCICCGYSVFLKSDMRKHLYKKNKPCPKSVNNIDLTDEIRDFILENRVYHIDKNTNNKAPILQQLVNLKIENAMLKNRKDESFYQLIVEKYLGSSHLRIASGVTDVTTDTIHAEIKRSSNYKEAVGQLTSYNIMHPMKELQVYMFDKCNKTTMDTAVIIFKNQKYKIHEFNISKNKVDILDYETKEVLFTYIIDLK